MRVALIVMPLAAAGRPSLAAGLLQALLQARGISCDTKYFNVTLWKLLGEEAYSFLSQQSPVTCLAGEWAFSQAFYGPRFSQRDSYAREVLGAPSGGMRQEYWGHVWALQEVAPLFLRLALESCDWEQYDLVGFTSTFEQTMASLCLARMIRERAPRVKLAMGGANMEAGMGRQYLEQYAFLDYVSTGEAEESLPRLCESLREGRGEVPPGFVGREGGEVREAPRGRRPAPADLEALPVPSYEDFFRVLRASAGPRPPASWLPVETSRGCWWGERSHCTFCGLNGEHLAFRRKRWQQVAAEVEELSRRHGPLPLQFADNILGLEYFEDLLPYWAGRQPQPLKFFEIKSNLKRPQVKLLKEAGVGYVQAGVESLSDSTLRLMRKGVSAAQNVALLRWCHELGIQPMWNLLYGFPREDLEDYARVLELLQGLTHLRPPDACSVIRLDRFSPNHGAWREQGFTRVAPVRAYSHVFPFAPEVLEALACYFRYEHPQLEQALERGRRWGELCERWQARAVGGSNGELVVRPHWQGGFVLVDTRFNLRRRVEPLEPEALALLLACDAPTSRAGALEAAARHVRAGMAERLDSLLSRLLEQRVVAAVGRQLVTLALLTEELRQQTPVGGMRKDAGNVTSGEVSVDRG